MLAVDGNITSTERMVSACSGGLFTTFMMTPLDVVKVRMQSQFVPQRTAYTATQPQTTLAAMRLIVKEEGFFKLWRGVSAGLIMAVPSTVIYFSGYDWIKQQVQSSRFADSVLYDTSPLWAGAIARITAATMVSPLELFRTRLQAANGTQSVIDVWNTVVSMVKRDGISSLWRGLKVTLLRDAPFSAFYWMGYESVKRELESVSGYQRNTFSNLQTSFIAGASSGMVAAALTTPFDLIKTQRQLSSVKNVSTVQMIHTIISQEGYRGLFRGVTPRVMRIAPGCAIMISSYEFGKLVFEDKRRESVLSFQ
ncbi:mitochondrial carrier domain-containing protein [Spinellus fusiger]|nr:mitochondrial carrier domain-containing protein [Spinellus fusiger]